jgi:molecular chaperone GrpE
MNKEQNTTESNLNEAATLEQATASAAAGADAKPGSEQVDIEELKKQAAKAAESWDRLLRTTADFDNFRKRAARDKQEAIRFANESLLEKLIPVLDSFDAALHATKTTESDKARALEQGVEMVFQQLKQVLKDSGMEEIDATGAPFDPNFHEAISTQETAEVPEGQVVIQARKGYKLRERLLRPASVVVSKSPEK